METKYIKEFLVLAEMESSYAAAEKLFVSQTTLVRHIQALEDEFGMPLFTRSKRGFVLNEAGQVFMTYAQKIVMAQEDCYHILHHEDGAPRVLRLCSQGKIIDLLIDFKKEHPEYQIDYNRCEPRLEELRSGKAEVAFVSDVLPVPQDLETVPYYREEALAVLYDGHPLAGQDAVTLEDLKGEGFIALCNDMVYDGVFTEMFSKLGFVQDVVATVPTGNDMLRMVSEGLGISIIHGVAETVPDYPGLKCIPLEPRIQYTMLMCYRKDLPLSVPAQQFVDFSKRWIAFHQDLNLSLFR